MPIQTHYDNLKVARHANPSEIKTSYRKLCQQHHPDKQQGNPAEAERLMKLINEAYAVLSDPARRKEHDRWIADQEAISTSVNWQLIFTQQSAIRRATVKRQAPRQAAMAGSQREYTRPVKQYPRLTGRQVTVFLAALLAGTTSFWVIHPLFDASHGASAWRTGLSIILGSICAIAVPLFSVYGLYAFFQSRRFSSGYRTTVKPWFVDASGPIAFAAMIGLIAGWLSSIVG